MKRKNVLIILLMIISLSLSGCIDSSEVPDESSGKNTEVAGLDENEKAEGDFKIGIVTPTLSTSEDEFRAAAEMVEKYPGMVEHLTLPENFNAELETGISQILSFADDKDIKGIIVTSGQTGLLPAFEKIKERRPDILTVATMFDEPKLMSKYVDMSFATDWARRGVEIPTKAKEMGAKTFIHYSFPTHLAQEGVSTRRDNMKKTCEELGLEFVEIITPDPQTGDGVTPMLEFLREDVPRQIEKYGVDTNIFGSNCPMYDVIIDEALKLKYIVAEQCCPTPTQAYPTVMNLEIDEKDLGDYDKINQMIEEKSKEAGMTGRLSGWAMPSSVYVPKFEIELLKHMIENNLKADDVMNKEFLDGFSEEVTGIRADFEPVAGDINNYYVMILESIYY